jgi:hypothetical protein
VGGVRGTQHERVAGERVKVLEPLVELVEALAKSLL